jgi:hypothetical protein
MVRVSNAAGNARAQEIVNDLHMGGMSYSEIGRRLGGRDSSLISQIARKGNKGASFVDALTKVQGGAPFVNVPRKTTKAGTEARVRKGVGSRPGDNIIVKTKGGNKTILNGLGQVAGKGKFAKWNVGFNWVKTISDRKVKNTGLVGKLPKGWTTNDLMNRIANPQAGDNWNAGDARGALASIALQQNSSSITAAGAANEVTVWTMD